MEVTMSKRALRRHHKDRMRERARYVLTKVWWHDESRADHRSWVEHNVPRMADTMKRCSRPGCCGQMRKTYGMTIQERRQIDA
jgi:hypothetical protein